MLGLECTLPTFLSPAGSLCYAFLRDDTAAAAAVPARMCCACRHRRQLHGRCHSSTSAPHHQAPLHQLLCVDTVKHCPNHSALSLHSTVHSYEDSQEVAACTSNQQQLTVPSNQLVAMPCMWWCLLSLVNTSQAGQTSLPKPLLLLCCACMCMYMCMCLITPQCIYPMDSPGGYQLVGRTLPIWNTFGRTGPFSKDKPWLLEFFDQVDTGWWWWV